MKVSQAAETWMNYHQAQSKRNTIRAYRTVITKFCEEFGKADLGDLTPDVVLSFLNRWNQNSKPQTKRIRYAYLSSFFNFVRDNMDSCFISPCDSPLFKKLYKSQVTTSWEMIEKETVDEIIFRTTKVRNRLMLELMARGGMRVGKVLKLTANDIQGRKLILRDPKSGKEREYVFIPQKTAERLKDYAKSVCENPEARVFQISYEAARILVAKAGKLVGIKLKPHDLRRHAATYASRAGVPIEIVSKVILRHANLATTKSFNCIPSEL